MKKHFLAGVVTGFMCLFAALFVLAQAWSHLSWPYARYYVQLDLSKPSGTALCEVYTGVGVAKRILPMPATDDLGHVRNCVLEITGEMQADGSLTVIRRPGNLLYVDGWKQRKFGVLQKTHIAGLCTEAEYGGTAKASAECEKLQLSELPSKK